MDKIVTLVTPAPDLSRCCATCPNWEKRDDVPNIPEPVGDCRFKIPTVVLLPVSGPLRGQGVQIQPVFPLMLASQWCANHPIRKAESAAAFLDHVFKAADISENVVIRNFVSFLNR